MREDAIEIDGLGFSYPAIDGERPATPVLDGITASIPEGSFSVLLGATGSGKTTLLRLLKPELAPHGEKTGSAKLFGTPLDELSSRRSAAEIGYVFQNPENQIVCDTVWHELAFGLENLGLGQQEMHQRVAEACYFFGIEPWYRKRTAELSGGQKQILALAALMVMRPEVLLLDEPASMLDPLAQKTFLSLLYRMNQELGITVVVCTHAPKALAPYADHAFLLHGYGETSPQLEEIEVGHLKEEEPLIIASGLHPQHGPFKEPVIDLRGAYFRYARNAPWVLRNLDLSVRKGEIRALVGGNGSGKSTLLSVIAGLVRSQHGHVRNAARSLQAFLPQNPKALFSKETIAEELMEWGGTVGYGMDEARACLERLRLPCDDAFVAHHPYDVSGGQQQLVALAKLLLTKPKLLLLDEPSRGLDRTTKSALVEALLMAQAEGVTIIMSSHDEELIEAAASSVSLLFDGAIALTAPTAEFLSASWLWGQKR